MKDPEQPSKPGLANLRPGPKFPVGHGAFPHRARIGNRHKQPLPVEMAKQMGIDPIQVMLHVLKFGAILRPDGTELPVDAAEQMRTARELAPYMYSKAPTVATSTNETRVVTVDVSKFMESPELAQAAELLALSLLESPEEDEPPTFDAEFSAE